MPRLSLLPLLALLASASAAQPPQACPTEGGVQDIYGSPAQSQAIARGVPVRIRRGAIVALERFDVTRRIWRADREIRIGGANPYVYKTGSVVTAVASDSGERRCLRDAGAPRDGPAEGAYIACLIDADDDGAHDAAELFWRDDLFSNFGRPARFERVALVTLETPVRLREDPAGLEEGRTAALRRIAVVGLSGETAEVELSHAAMVERAPRVFRVNGRVVRPRAPTPVPKFRPWPGGRRTIRLADGAVEIIGGIGFRIARSGSGWTMTPLADRFAPWITFECGGSRLQIGRS